jgi:nitroreductase
MSKDSVMDLDLASVDHVLMTTRSVRRRLDFETPVPLELIEEALEIALQAPTGANTQTWRFMIVTEGEARARIADFYRKAAEAYVEGRTGLAKTGVTMLREYEADDLRQQQRAALMKSGGYLMQHLQRVPVMIIPCIEGRFEGDDVFTQASMWGSILPATWSLMLALRARRLASAWTTLHLLYEREIGELLGIPPHYTQAALLPVAWLEGGDLKPAKRLPVEEVTFWGRWGQWRE